MRTALISVAILLAGSTFAAAGNVENLLPETDAKLADLPLTVAFDDSFDKKPDGLPLLPDEALDLAKGTPTLPFPEEVPDKAEI